MGMSKSLSAVDFLRLLNDQFEAGIAFCGLRKSLWSNWGRYDFSGQGCIGRLKAFLCSYNLISQGKLMSFPRQERFCGVCTFN